MTEIRGSDPGGRGKEASSLQIFQAGSQASRRREQRRPQETEAEEMRELGD